MAVDFVASGGDALLRFLKNAKSLKEIFVRPAFLSFRVTDLDTGNPTSTPATPTRINPNYDLVWDRLSLYVQPLAADTVVAAQHGFVNFRISGENQDLFDDPVSMVHFCLPGGVATTPGVTAGAISGIQLPIPRLIDAGKDVTSTFTAEAGFGAADRIVDALMIGTYVHKSLEIASFEGMSAPDLSKLLTMILNRQGGP